MVVVLVGAWAFRRGIRTVLLVVIEGAAVTKRTDVAFLASVKAAIAIRAIVVAALGAEVNRAHRFGSAFWSLTISWVFQIGNCSIPMRAVTPPLCEKSSVVA